MNWSKVKSIMIVFLILVNLSFLSYIIYDEICVNKRNEQMANTTASLLQSRNITVDTKMIADCLKNESIESVYVDNVISSYADFSKKILGESLVFVTKNKYQSEIGQIEFWGDIFKARANEGKHLYEANISSQNAKNISKKYLNMLGINTEKTQISEENNNYKLIYTKEINSLPVFEAGITVEMDSLGVVSIYGNWYNISSQNSSAIELKSVSGVLVEYMNQQAESDKSIQVTNISLGYSALDPNTYHESVFLTPVWKISDSAKDFYIDARENS